MVVHVATTGTTRIPITVAVTTGYDPIVEELPVMVRVVTLVVIWVVVCVMVRGAQGQGDVFPDAPNRREWRAWTENNYPITTEASSQLLAAVRFL
jgi:hypothetical protein